jgi:hypothetical protein
MCFLTAQPMIRANPACLREDSLKATTEQTERVQADIAEWAPPGRNVHSCAIRQRNAPNWCIDIAPRYRQRARRL